MNKKIGCLIISIVLILIPTILGYYDTRIDIFTKPYEEVSVKILYDFGANEGRLIDSEISSFNNLSDKNGIISFLYKSPEPLIRISVRVVNETENYRYFNRIFAGKRIFIDMTATNSIPVVTELNQAQISSPSNNTHSQNQTNNQTSQNNQSIQENKSILEDNQQQKSKSNNADYKSTIIIYLLIVLGLVVLIFIILLIRRFLKRRQKLSSQPMQKIKFYPKGRPQSPEDSEDREIKEAEERIRLAQREVEAIKERKKEIKEAERKLQQDLDRLKQLKRR
jgi:hypothetical protein